MTNQPFKMMKKKTLFVFLISQLLVQSFVFSQKVDTVEVYSTAMDKKVKNAIILPDGYDGVSDKKYPVLYLLHGYSGNHGSWLKIKPDLTRLASFYKMIIVCPDGRNSWYWDSPNDPKMQYETFVSKELVSYLDKNYKTISDLKGRAITGLSMGGHGGLWLGIRNQGVFGACGSMSGGVDILPFPENWEMKKQLGDFADNRQVWEEHSVINQINKIRAGKLSIIIDCGTGDFFYGVNKALHEKLNYMNIPHDYIERPGAHNAPYWNNAIEYQVLYFSRFFEKN